MNDLTALRIFETPSPGHYTKYAAIKTLMECGVPKAGIARLIDSSPWPIESKEKWHKNLRGMNASVCPYCAMGEVEDDCPVGAFMSSPEARLTPMEVDLLPNDPNPRADRDVEAIVDARLDRLAEVRWGGADG